LVGLISINYKIAPIEIREKFHFDNSEKIRFNNLLKKKIGVEGLMIISTCNRTEIYFEFENHIGQEKKFLHSIIKELSEFRSFKDSLSPYLRKKIGSYEVAKHLFRLVSGLESMIIGEFQIVEQLKEAYYFARDKKMLGPILSRMIQKSLETGKYIRTNTDIGKGAVSVSYAAIEEITKRFDLSDSSFLCVGLGETSKLSIRHLHQKKISNIKVANRTNKKAIEFSKELDLDTIKFKNFKKEMESIDVVIFSTSSKKPIIKKEELIQISKRRDSDLLIIDLSVPRNIPSSAYEINGINVINIDNLKDTVNENYKKRSKEIGKAKKQIDEFLQEFDDWTNSRQLRPSILSLKNQIKELIIDEALNNFNSSEPEDINHQLTKAYDKFSDNLIRKIKKASNNGKDEKAIGIINQIFLNEK
tara:strand:+ start:1600 stop:2850 length:1251 start_codon:yes stop_codon:yes gene_type:complete